MSLVIRNCTISEIEAAPNISELLEEYACESSISGLPHPSAKGEVYKLIESTGALHTIAAFLDDMLIGFVTILASPLPHYGILIAVVESIFVTKAHRKTGAGLKLIREAERYAKSVRSPGLLVSAPYGGDLAEVLPSIGYVESNRVFFKRAYDA